MQQKLGIATRFYGLDPKDKRRLKTWIDAALTVVSEKYVYIAINAELDKSGSYAFVRKNYPAINVFSVTPWGKVVQAPNALLIKSAEHKLTYLLFTSTEYPVFKSFISRLISYFDSVTLVVGARLPTHDFVASEKETVLVKEANGLQIPWNTFAMWSLDHLIHTGFVLTADSFTDPNNAGMEEMGTIAAQQILWRGNAIAKLVSPKEGELIANTYNWTIERHKRHTQIMKSKNSRSRLQLERLSLPAPAIYHIDS